MSTSVIDVANAGVRTIAVNDESLTAKLADGRTISVPLGWYPRLLRATPDERDHWRLVGDGEGVHWPDLDEDISAENIVLGQPSGESQRSLQRWLRQREKNGIE
jgi:hypothetical protein